MGLEGTTMTDGGGAVTLGRLGPWLVLCACALISAVTPVEGSRSQDGLLIPTLQRHPLLSGDYVGLAIELDLDLGERANLHILRENLGELGDDRAQYRYNAWKGFAITKIRAGPELLWMSETFHAEHVLLDVFGSIRYLKFSVYFAENFMELKHYSCNRHLCLPITRMQYVEQTVKRLVHDTIELTDGWLSLVNQFKVVGLLMPWVHGTCLEAKFNHAFTKVAFNGRVLWTYNPAYPLECLRVDLLKHPIVTLVLLHLVDLDGHYRTVLMYGKGSHTMSLAQYNNCLQEIAKLPPIVVDGKQVDFEVMKPKRHIYDANVEEELRKNLIHLVEDGKVEEHLKANKAVAKDDSEYQEESLPLVANGYGLFTFEVFRARANRLLDIHYKKNSDDIVSRVVYSAKEGYLVGKLVDKNMVLIEAGDIFAYKAVLYQLELVKVLQVFATTIDGEAKMKYFIRGSAKTWRECGRREFMMKRLSEMKQRTVDLADLGAARNFLVISRRENLVSRFKKQEDDNFDTMAPMFQTFIKQVEYKEKPVWTFDPKVFRSLVEMRLWKHKGQQIFSIQTVDGEDRRHEEMYALKDDDWQLVGEGSFLRAHKTGVDVDISKWRNQGIRSSFARSSGLMFFGVMEPMAGHYIRKVVHGKVLMWQMLRSPFQCVAVYYLRYIFFFQVTLKMYDGEGNTHYVYLMKSGYNGKFVEVDALLAGYAIRHLPTGWRLSKFFSKNRFSVKSFLNYIRAHTGMGELPHRVGKGYSERLMDGKASMTVEMEETEVDSVTNGKERLSALNEAISEPTGQEIGNSLGMEEYMEMAELGPSMPSTEDSAEMSLSADEEYLPLISKKYKLNSEAYTRDEILL